MESNRMFHNMQYFKILLCSVFFIDIVVDVNAYVPIPTFANNAQQACKTLPRRSTLAKTVEGTATVIFARPPPTSKFNIDEILAYESELNKEEEKELDNTNNDAVDTLPSSSTSLITEYLVPKKLHNKRIDIVINFFETSFSRSFCGKLVTSGNVMISKKEEGTETNSVIDRKSHKVEAGTKIRINIPKEENTVDIVAQDIPLDILYEDEHMVVINKAADMVVHPAAGNWDGTIVNALAYYLQSSSYGSGEFIDSEGNVVKSKEQDKKEVGMDGTDGEIATLRPGIVHRLDKGTTGVLVVAKSTTAHAKLSEAFAARQVKKSYLAVTVGNPGKRVEINNRIGRHPIHRQRMRVVPDPHSVRSNSSQRRGLSTKERMMMTDIKSSTARGGRIAISYVDTIAFDGRLALAQVRIATGRTHQIRVHLQDRHTPIYGDSVYGLTDWNQRLLKTHKIARPLLHAHKLELNHPITGEKMEFEAPIAKDMLKIIKTIQPHSNDEIDSLLSIKS